MAIDRIADIGTQHRPLFRYRIRSADTGEVIYEGHAVDASDAEETARAHVEYLTEQRVAA